MREPGQSWVPSGRTCMVLSSGKEHFELVEVPNYFEEFLTEDVVSQDYSAEACVMLGHLPWPA